VVMFAPDSKFSTTSSYYFNRQRKQFAHTPSGLCQSGLVIFYRACQVLL